ncbi:MAG: hypothetical protein SGI73_06305 [Chloroflexota bacterium]|nr:hypothetical protein [Chloroflexota bacterium]
MTLPTLITDAADDPSKLNAIIADIEGSTLDSDNPTLYPAPTFDAATNTWTLTQSTPNANGLYEGIYTLPGTGTCSYVEIVAVTAHQNPAVGAPAKYKDCDGGAWIDQSSVSALNNKRVSFFSIVSAIAFSIKLRLIAAQCVSLVTFQNPACYTLLQNDFTQPTTLDTGFGNPAPSAKSGRQQAGNAYGIGLFVQANITMPTEISSVSIQYYWYTNNNPNNILAITVNIRDSEDNTLYQYDNPGAVAGGQNQWNTLVLSPNVTNAKYITFRASVVGSSGDSSFNGACWVDSIAWS